MGLTVAELLDGRMSSLEFTYRIAEHDIEPRGERPANRRAALVAATVANWSGYAKTPHTIEQYMPGAKAGATALDPIVQQQLAQLRRERKKKPKAKQKARNDDKRRNNHS